MTPRRRGPASSAAVLLVVALLTGCGGKPAGADGDAARAYASAVATATDGARRALLDAARAADYGTPAAADASTRRYAAGVEGVAGTLAGLRPPAAVGGPHRALVALYRGTSRRLGLLAGRFGATTDRSQAADVAQQLATELSAYRGREAELRAAIDAGLAGASPTGG